MRIEYRIVLAFVLLPYWFENTIFAKASYDFASTESYSASFDSDDNCTAPWHHYDAVNNTCQCGSELGGIIKCTKTKVAALLIGYCMYYNDTANSTSVISCPYDTSRKCSPEHLRVELNLNLSDLNLFMCGNLNRTGPYCQDCIDNHSVSVYTQDLRCYPCEGGLKPWVKYLGLELGFVTLFYIVIALFQINISSAAVNAFIFFGQIVVSLFVFELGVFQASLSHFSYGFIKVLQTCYGIWNLDFFRNAWIEPFCVSPKISNLEFIALQYLGLIYPFILVFFTFILVYLYRRKFRFVVILWFPFQRVFRLLKINTWRSDAVVVNMLSSFCILTYSKFIFLSANLVKAVPVYHMSNNSIQLPKNLFLQPSVLYFSKAHLPYALLVVVMTAFIVILPVFLIIYPSTCFQNCLKDRKSIAKYIRMFAANFQRCYKNRFLDNRDFRYFAGFYFILRLSVFTTKSAISNQIASWVAPGVVFLIGAIVIAIFRPYRQKLFNVIDGLLMLLFAIACGLISLATFKTQKYFSRFLFFVVFAIATLPLLCIMVYLAVHVVQILRECKCKRYTYAVIHEYGSDYGDSENGMGTEDSADVDSQTGQSESGSYQRM